MTSIGWFARNKVAANLIMALILAGGFLTVFSLKKEVFPEFSLNLITITVPYLGAAPGEVEEGVNLRIEEAIQGLDGVKEITSVASEGVGLVTVELHLGADVRKVLDDVKSRVDAIDTFPDETEKPIIREITNRREVIDVAVSGPVDERTLRTVAEQVRDDIAALPGITVVELANARPFEIAIQVAEEDLRRHGLTFDAVAEAVRRSSLDLPGGTVKTEAGEVLLRTKGQAYQGEEFERLVLLTRPDGTHLRLGEVARVVDGFEDTDQSARFDQEPALMIQVFRTGEQSALAISDAVHGYVETAQARMPPGIRLTTWNDAADILRSRLDLMVRNGRAGFILVFITLAVFLRFRLAFWVSLGLLISFMGAIWLMPALGVSINLISLFAFILVLGIVVDDAIVVGENIYTEQAATHAGLQGAIRGAEQVSLPVVFAVLTTVAAFVPLLFVAGTTGKIMRVIPLIVIPCLLWSLVESLWILPAHLSHYRPPREVQAGDSGWHLWRRFQRGFAHGLRAFIQRGYRPWLERALEWRYLTLAAGVAALLLTLGAMQGGLVRFVFFPEVESDFISAAVTMPPGTPQDATSAAVGRLEASAERVRQELRERTGGQDLLEHMFAAVGEHPFRTAQRQNAGGAAQRDISSSLGEVTIQLAPAETRTISSAEIAERWRDATGDIPDAIELDYTATLFSPGADVDVQLTGSDLDRLQAAAEILKARLREYAGVYEITDSFRAGKEEIKLDILPSAEVLGLTLRDLGRQVRQAFYGEEAQRIQRGRHEVRVMVRYPPEERRSLSGLENMRIRTPDGSEIPFSEVARATTGRGYASIRRVERRRAVNVTADVDPAQATPGDVIQDLQSRVLPGILAAHPGVRATFEGQQAEQRETIGGLVNGFLLALIAIYALLAIPLRSYAQPLIIMGAIPFGLVGAVWGHLLIGLDLTILSMFGLVALTGVVVNDSLVMVDFINHHRKDADELHQGVRQAGVARFRPILLTSLTTFAGLSPLMLERSMQARFLIPMAVSLAFGVLFATVITLFLVPAGYMVLEDLKGILSRLLGVAPAAGEAAGTTGDAPPAAAGREA